jgi:hypothetical protein
MLQIMCIYLSEVSCDQRFSEPSSVGLASVVGSCADFKWGGGNTSHFQLIFSLFYIFIYISRDRLWVGESIVTSCGELGGAGRLQ